MTIGYFFERKRAILLYVIVYTFTAVAIIISANYVYKIRTDVDLHTVIINSQLQGKTFKCRPDL